MSESRDIPWDAYAVTAVVALMLCVLTFSLLFSTYSNINSSRCWKTGSVLFWPTVECKEEPPWDG